MSFSTTTPWAQSAGNGVTTEFALNHKIYDEGDIVVLLTVDATNVTTQQTITTHYTVSGVAVDAHDNTTPTVTMLTAPASGETLTRFRLVDLIQDTSFGTNEFWQSLSAELQFDLIVQMIQHIHLIIDTRVSKYGMEIATVAPSLTDLLATVGYSTLDTLTTKAALVAADVFRIGDSADSGLDKKITATILATYIATLHYLKSEHIDTSAGAGDAGKPIKLDAGGHVDATMVNDADISHDNTTGVAASTVHDAHPLLVGRSGGQTLSGSDTTAEDLTLKDNTTDNKTITVTEMRGTVKNQITAFFDATTTGAKQIYLRAPCAGTITKATLFGDVSGSLVVDVWKDTYANFPPTVADTITSAAKPTLSGAQKYEDSTLTGWTKTFIAGDVFEFNVDSSATITKGILTLDYDKTGV